MKKNMGLADRLLRGVVAAVVVVLYLTGVITGALGIVLVVLSGVFLLTSFTATCPLYGPLGISTLRKKTAGNSHV